MTKQPPAPATAILYARTSSDEQTRGCAEQLALGLEWCRAHGVRVLSEHRDEGIPGGGEVRPGFDAAMRAVEEHRPTFLVLFDRARLSRSKSAKTAIALEAAIEKRGTRIVLTSTGRVSSGSAADVLVDVLESQQAGEYSRGLARTSVRGATDRARKGHPGGRPTPFGYCRVLLAPGGGELLRVFTDPDGGRTVVEPDGRTKRYPKGAKLPKWETSGSTFALGRETDVREVVWIFEQRAKGIGLRQIVRELNRRNVAGRRWTTSKLWRVLSNEVYRGAVVSLTESHAKILRAGASGPVEVEPEREKRWTKRPAEERITVAGAVPAIVSDELWAASRSPLERRPAPRGRGSSPGGFLLAGRAVCAACGASVHGNTPARGKGLPVYTCARLYDHGRGAALPGCGRMRARDLEGGVLAKLTEAARRLGRDRMLELFSLEDDGVAPAPSALAQARAARAACAERMENLIGNLETLPPSAAGSVRERIRALDGEQRDLEQRIRDLEATVEAGTSKRLAAEELVDALEGISDFVPGDLWSGADHFTSAGEDPAEGRRRLRRAIAAAVETVRVDFLEGTADVSFLPLFARALGEGASVPFRDTAPTGDAPRNGRVIRIRVRPARAPS